jgi:mannose-6-phosphate isomerase-like protein (cupin superfamily)
MTDSAWQVFDVADLKKKVAGSEPRFLEFLRVAKLSCAIYRLPAGARDMQAPHLEDEIYIVVEGCAKLRIGGQVQDVRPGIVLFIQANVEHSFVDIEEDLALLAVFSAPEKPWKA